MRFNRFLRKVRQGKVKSPGWFRPMDIAPNEYGEVDYPAIKKVLEAALEKDWGPRCVVKDYDEFPELEPLNAVGDPDVGRCPACLVYEKFDNFWNYFSPDDVS